jgi:hypothetical protein
MAQGLVCLTLILVYVGIAFSSCNVVACFIHVLLSETDNNEEGIVKVFREILWK